MKPIPRRPDPTPPPPARNAYLIYLPGGMPVLRAAVEELVRSSWNDSFRDRACEIATAFEGAFRSSAREDLAGLVRSMRFLLELSPAEFAALGPALLDKLEGLLQKLEALLDADGESLIA
jgi:hypothetical protein